MISGRNAHHVVEAQFKARRARGAARRRCAASDAVRVTAGCSSQHQGRAAWLRTGTTQRSVVVLDYGSGNLRSAERALARAGADVDGDRRRGRRARGRRARRPRRRGVRRLHARASTPCAAAPSSGTGCASSARCSASASACRSCSRRASSTARQTDGPRRAARHGDAARGRRRPAHGLEHRRRRRRAARCSPGWRTSASTSCTPTRARATSPDVAADHAPSTASASPPRSSAARCRRRSSTPRRAATPGPPCCRTG